jgi:serine/threonine protein phosphatase PrpC
VLRLAHGDFLLVFSDGLIEGIGCRAEELVGRVEATASARELVDQLVELAPTQESRDDVTVLVLKSVA